LYRAGRASRCAHVGSRKTGPAGAISAAETGAGAAAGPTGPV